MKPIIRVENLSKQYRIGKSQEPYGTLRESLTRIARAPFRRIHGLWEDSLAALRHRQTQTEGNGERLSQRTGDTIWALKDVSFEVRPGEVVGIIGRNGAGKSTLLKILSRITEPTTGRAELYGRVGSLLEVGTGFHPELTGRENIYLNGAILGMGRQEIAHKIEDIVEFSGIEIFLDTPVKRYSSGMLLRLAFAVAAHLESDLLIIDEVLAVGDVSFQEKCLGKIGDVTKSGRTVLFVSHNEGTVRHLCSRCLLLYKGQIMCDDEPGNAYSQYLQNRNDTTFSSENERYDTGKVHILNASLMIDEESTNGVARGRILKLQFEVEVLFPVPCAPAILIRDENSVPIIFSWLASNLGWPGCPPRGRYDFAYQLQLPKLAVGSYSVDIMLGQVGIGFHHYLEGSLVFRINSAVHPETGWDFQQSYNLGRVLIEASELYGPMPAINKAES